MKKQFVLWIGLCGILGLSSSAFASTFDEYLQEKKMIDENFQIIDKPALTELVTALSEEDSKTFPIEIDHNTILERLEMNAEQTTLTGLIITPDFEQFEKDLGETEVKKIIQQNLIKNCSTFFEHEYQRHNPYKIELKLSSSHNSYHLTLTQQDCNVTKI